MDSRSHDAGDDTDFDEYDPDPYDGGYDIALTYGRPLRPSPATCYPIIESAHPPDPTPPPPPTTPPPDSSHLPKPEPEPYAPPPAYDYGGESGYRPVSHDWADLDVFGFWPFVSERWGRCADVEEVGYWSQWKRAGDYLFGYSEGFGERRIGVDSFGIPIYANKKGIGDAVSVQVEPARDLRVDRCESDTCFSSYDEKKDVSYGYVYNKYHYQEPLHVEENLNEPSLLHRLTYHEDYEEREHPKLEWQSSYSDYGDESYSYVNHQYACERHIEQPLCVELEPHKPTWSQNLNYQEYYDGNLSIESNYHSSVENGVGYESNTYGVPNNVNEWHYPEKPQSVQLELFEPAWSQNLTLYEHSSMDNGAGYESNTYGVPNNVNEWHHSEKLQSVQLELFEPAWSQNLTLDEHSSMDNGTGYESNTFEVPNIANEWHYSEQLLPIQLEPFKPTWSQNPSLYDPYNFQSSWVDDSKEYGAQYFSPFLEHSRYDD